MWWGLIRSSWLIIFCACTVTKPKMYLASSLAQIEPELKSADFDLHFLSSSDIVTQIEHGAPCDAVWLADEKSWQLLKDKALVGEAHFYLKNRLALIGLSPEKIDFMALKNLKGSLIIADSFVPLGGYTLEALRTLGYEPSKQLIKAPSARQAAMLLEQKAAQYAILYQSDFIPGKNFLVATIDEKLHRPIRYPFSICKNADVKKFARIYQLISSPAFKEALIKIGFGVP